MILLVKKIYNMKKSFIDSINVKKEIINSNQLQNLQEMGDIIVSSIISGGKLMLCGNGGSAADAQHLAAELLVRLRPTINRKGIPAITLAQDSSTMTACANDYSYDIIFERMLETLANEGDVLLCISTSGNSKNILNTLIKGKNMNVKVLALLGGDGGKALPLCENYFLVPTNNTARIQESHITAGHALMEYIEDKLIDLNYLTVK